MEPATSLEPTDGPLTAEELQLATRNRGMPLEAIAYDVTPTGLHYLLVHFDIPTVDARLEADGRRQGRPAAQPDPGRHPRAPRQTLPVTMECAGNGRARLAAAAQPAVARRGGEHGRVDGHTTGRCTWPGRSGRRAVDSYSPERSRRRGGDEHDYARSLSLADAMRPEVLLAYEMNGRPLEPQHGTRCGCSCPGWYGMTSVKWLRDRGVDDAFDGYQQRVAYWSSAPRRCGQASPRDPPRAP